MRQWTVDEVRGALPDLDELQPILDDLVGRSEPDPAKVWSGSGQLGTAATRLVSMANLESEIAALGRAEADRIGATYAVVGKALVAWAEGDLPNAARAFLEAVDSEEARDRPDRANAYAEAAYRAVGGQPGEALAALALRRSARALRALGELDESLLRYARSHELARATGEARAAAEAAIGAGNVLEDQGLWNEAESWYRAALDAVNRVDEPVAERWHALLNLHIVARSRGDVEGSVPLLQQAAEQAALVDSRGAAPFLDNARGQLLMARGAHEEAEKHFRAAVSGAEASRARVTMRLNLAESFLARGHSLDAAEHAREAEREAIRARMVPKLPEVYRLLGRIAAAERNPDAFVLFERALEIVAERGLPKLEKALTLQAYAEAEASRGDDEGAHTLRHQARGIFASLGITEERQRWADVFGPATKDDQPARGQT